jgi:hypothetical protein
MPNISVNRTACALRLQGRKAVSRKQLTIFTSDGELPVGESLTSFYAC